MKRKIMGGGGGGVVEEGGRRKGRGEGVRGGEK